VRPSTTPVHFDCSVTDRPAPDAGRRVVIGYLTPDRSAYVAVLRSGVTPAATVGRHIAVKMTSGRMPVENYTEPRNPS